MNATIIEKDNLLLVEGKDEKNFFDELIKYLRLADIQVLDIAGKTLLQRNLKALTLSPGFSRVKSIGIVRDANGNHDAAFKSVCSALNNSNLPNPDAPLVQINNDIKITIFIMPGLNLSGMLEDLCLKSVENDNVFFCINSFFECLVERKCVIPNNTSKARLQVFLASREKPGLRLGEAARAGYWPWENEAFLQLKQFLNQIVS